MTRCFAWLHWVGNLSMNAGVILSGAAQSRLFSAGDDTLAPLQAGGSSP